MVKFTMDASLGIEKDKARSRMTEIQWASLAQRLNFKALSSELPALPRFSRLKQGKNIDCKLVALHLRNGWATETLVHHNKLSFKDEALSNSLVWAYPQIYYSAYAITLAYFHAVGFTETKSHASLIKKFGNEIKSNHYPISIAFYVDGGQTHTYQYGNCAKDPSAQGLKYDPECSATRDSRIASLLSSTREIDLKERLIESKAKTKSGKIKKRFDSHEYDSASRSEGVTTIFNYLYRKRIKSNYRDIDSILCPHLNATLVYNSLTSILYYMNFLHEAYIIQCIGFRQYEAIIEREHGGITGLSKSRALELKAITTNA